jgi:hypothetical protein
MRIDPRPDADRELAEVRAYGVERAARERSRS